MLGLIVALHIIICLSLVVVVLLQSGKGGGLAGAFGGGGGMGAVFGGQAAATFLTKSTRYLAIAAQEVIAVEIDDRLLPALHETLAPFKNVRIVVGDILKLDPAYLLSGQKRGAGSAKPSSVIRPPSSVPHPSSYKVVANIPYYITSALIRHLLEAEIKPKRMVLTVQKEVGQRICEQPPKMSLLALSVQVYGEPTIAAKIPAGAFYPAPKIDSAVVRIELYPDPLISAPLLPIFFRLAKAGFSQKRKMLRNSLSAGMAWPKDQAETVLKEAGIDPQRRAQTLSLAEWEMLSRCVGSGT